MAIAAVPKYLGTDFSTASPGLRFGMYLPIWGEDANTHEAIWTTHDLNYRPAGRDHEIRQFKDENKTSALKQSCTLTQADKAAMQALAARQQKLAESTADLFILDTTSIAPFTTGLGNEHPLENGFAFLNPYGLPYLPGSGIKGVLRQAARELVSGKWGDAQGWNGEIIQQFFGSDKEPLTRGALVFWDAIPQLAGEKLAVDIMTPHQTHYYQNGETPHESGSPNPISFLTAPPKSTFTFYVQCDQKFTHPENWQKLLEAAFAHAFDWLGFGAKTAVGYGAMESEVQRQNREAEQKAEKEAAVQANAEIWPDARIQFNRANRSLSVEKNGKRAIALPPKGEELLKALPADIQQEIRNGSTRSRYTAHVSGRDLVGWKP